MWPALGDCAPSGVACSFAHTQDVLGGISASTDGGFLSIYVERHAGSHDMPDRPEASCDAISASAPSDTPEPSNMPES